MSKIKSKIESLLFISAKPMSVKQLASILKAKEDDVKKAGEELVGDYTENKRGIQIIKNASKYQMVSSAENAKLIQDFLSDETSGELSRPSLETLTIIAYRGPISKIDLDRIRGVNCSLILRNLLLRGLVEVKNDKNTDDSWYSVSMDFIRFLGIRDLSELPDYERLSSDNTVDQVLDEYKQESKKDKIQDDKKDDNTLTKDKESELEESIDEKKHSEGSSEENKNDEVNGEDSSEDQGRET